MSTMPQIKAAGRYPEGVIHCIGHCKRLYKCSGSQAAHDNGDGKKDSKRFPFASHSAFNVIHGASIVYTVLPFDAVILRQSNFHAFCQHTEQGNDPHPEYGARPAHKDGGGNA